ncbi:hypothetical protein GW17_00025022 [Ensete ventricosum]|nr:hypothetical protein GW17_00025022 [Ensete ventricosum]
MVMAFLLVSSWLPATKKQGKSRSSNRSVREKSTRLFGVPKRSTEEIKDRGRSSNHTPGGFVLLRVPLARRLGLLAVTASHLRSLYSPHLFLGPRGKNAREGWL